MTMQQKAILEYSDKVMSNPEMQNQMFQLLYNNNIIKIMKIISVHVRCLKMDKQQYESTKLNEIINEMNNNINIEYKTLKIMTINCKNIRNNFMYINEELEKQDIIFIQEHWLNEYEIHNLQQYINLHNHNAHLISSIELNENKQGRPHGGIGWLINKKRKIKEIKNISKRI